MFFFIYMMLRMDYVFRVKNLICKGIEINIYKLLFWLKVFFFEIFVY